MHWFCPECKEIVFGKMEPFNSMCKCVGDMSLVRTKEIKEIQAKWKKVYIKI